MGGIKVSTIKGQLEIDHQRGVIYFHADEGGTILRICQLPTPIPDAGVMEGMLDIMHMHNCSWGNKKTSK